MGYPRGLKITEHPPEGGWDGYEGPVVVFVHGSLDRGDSFLRTVRRLPGWGAVTYDRRGYQGSRDLPPTDLGGHVEDLLGVVGGAPGDPSRVSAVGHSVGGDVVVGAAIAAPRAFASIGAFEPPMPWLGIHLRPAPATPPDVSAPRRWPPLGDDPGVEAERFFRRMVGDAIWDRLPESTRLDRRADGPALVADLRSIRGPAPFDVTALTVPTLFGRSGPGGEAHHRETASWLVAQVPGAELMEIEAARHGAHLSHPGAFARFVERAVALGA
jgi:pimeloyl-ACP methyl ester carboxylesterase